MPLNDKKIISIISEECRSVDDRCEGYREEIFNVLTDIITAEQQHRTQGTNIQQQVNDKCNAAGRYLAEKRGDSTDSEEEAS